MRFISGAETESPDDGSLFSSQLDSLRDVTLHLIAIIESMKEGSRREVKRATPLHEAVQRFEANLLRRALVSTNGNKARAARMLGVKVTTFHEKLKKHQIDVNRL